MTIVKAWLGTNRRGSSMVNIQIGDFFDQKMTIEEATSLRDQITLAIDTDRTSE